MSDHFYRTAEWTTFRAAVLRERGRVCAVPGCPKRATHLDHVTSLRRDGAPLDRANVQALCHSHHSSKTAQVDGGFGNTRASAVRLVVVGCDADGLPLDPGHHWSPSSTAWKAPVEVRPRGTEEVI